MLFTLGITGTGAAAHTLPPEVTVGVGVSGPDSEMPAAVTKSSDLAPTELKWLDNYEKALADAKEKKRPVIVNFTAPWCSACRQMDAVTMRKKWLQDEVQEYTLVKVDYDTNGALAAKYRVRGIPAYVLLNQFGEFVALSTGYSEADQFHNWLVTYFTQSTATISAADRLESMFADWDVQLRSPDSLTRGRAMERVLALYLDQQQPESGRNVAREHLKDLVRDNPAYTVNYIDDDRLAVRILFSNLFSEKFGEAFQYDPWETAEVRRPVVAIWEGKLKEEK
jgi:thiol:disulfide interchange protein DsbD